MAGNRLGALAGSVGKGLAAGVVGTVAMTVSSTLEMKLRNREASDAPAEAVAKVLQVNFTDEDAKERFSNLVHFGYGTAWGALRGLFGGVGVPRFFAAPLHFAAVWGSEATMLPALEMAPPLPEWGAAEIAVDLFHHLVYVAATDAAFMWLDS